MKPPHAYFFLLKKVSNIILENEILEIVAGMFIAKKKKNTRKNF